ncbi:MAG: argininosuccinate lyase [Bacteroidetes bacterium]|jgi:argininosuccinate lyase|nr:argininosuccinate lyase [Bacteroidota bacterium]
MPPIWQKTDESPDAWVTRFTVGADAAWDTILLPYDVEGTRAHAWGLSKIGVLTAEEYAAIADALDELLRAYEEGDVVVEMVDEDSHTVIERFLTEQLGATGRKVHTGRSRNDQVLVSLRLYLRQAIDGVQEQLAALVEQCCSWGEAWDEQLMPGYTHDQPAMPTTVGAWALGYGEVLLDDLELLQTARHLVNRSPLGSAAGYGVPHLDLPRAAVAERLGFDGVQTHVASVQLSRGKLEAAIAHAYVQIGATLNRLASDLMRFNSKSYGFAELPEAYCTGSSIMPQKKNPDVLELARATFPRLQAEAQVLLALPANLPSGYHRDLQFTKDAIMRATQTVSDLVEAVTRVASGVTFCPDQMEARLTPELFATAQALKAVAEGVPFRDAYQQAAANDAAWTVPKPADVLAGYTYDGAPGQGRPDLLRQCLRDMDS